VKESSPSYDLAPGWAESLFTGAPGIALLHIEYARTGAGGWDTVHEWAVAMTRSPVTAHPDACGLDRGAPAVAFCLHAAGKPGYASALAMLDANITALTRHRLERAYERIGAGQLPALREFDLIRGLTGIGAYLLQGHGGGDLLRDVLSYLVRLTEPLKADDGKVVPGWWSGNAPNDQPGPTTERWCRDGGRATPPTTNPRHSGRVATATSAWPTASPARSHCCRQRCDTASP
jgi:hypothetical protein